MKSIGSQSSSHRTLKKMGMSEMAINSVLESVLNEDVVETPSKDKTITLWEKNQDVDMEVKVVELSAPVTAIRMNSHLSILREKGDLKKICDYLLIVKSDGGIHAVFIELKKSLAQKGRASEQLRRSPPLLAYLLSVCKIEDNSIDTTRLNTNYFIIGEKSDERLAKQTMRISPNKMIEKEQYKEIEIATSTKTSFKLDELTNPK